MIVSKNPYALMIFFKLYKTVNESKDISLYINHRTNTNMSARKIYMIFLKIRMENGLILYLENIQKAMIDIHRIWKHFIVDPFLKKHKTDNLKL